MQRKMFFFSRSISACICSLCHGITFFTICLFLESALCGQYPGESGKGDLLSYPRLMLPGGRDLGHLHRTIPRRIVFQLISKCLQQFMPLFCNETRIVTISQKIAKCLFTFLFSSSEKQQKRPLFLGTKKTAKKGQNFRF